MARIAQLGADKTEQSPITVAPETVAAQGLEGRHGDTQSPAFGRLMTLKVAAQYLAISPWLVQQYIVSGDLPTVQLPRPATASAIRTGRRAPVGDTLRMVRLDKADLDAFVDQHGRKERR